MALALCYSSIPFALLAWRSTDEEDIRAARCGPIDPECSQRFVVADEPGTMPFRWRWSFEYAWGALSNACPQNHFQKTTPRTLIKISPRSAWRAPTIPQVILHKYANLRVPFILNLEEKLVRQICLDEFGLTTKILFLRAFPEKITLGRGNIFKTICLNKLPDFIS